MISRCFVGARWKKTCQLRRPVAGIVLSIAFSYLKLELTPRQDLSCGDAELYEMRSRRDMVIVGSAGPPHPLHRPRCVTDDP